MAQSYVVSISLMKQLSTDESDPKATSYLRSRVFLEAVATLVIKDATSAGRNRVYAGVENYVKGEMISGSACRHGAAQGVNRESHTCHI